MFLVLVVAPCTSDYQVCEQGRGPCECHLGTGRLARLKAQQLEIQGRCVVLGVAQLFGCVLTACWVALRDALQVCDCHCGHGEDARKVYQMQ